jgi:GNAT superfamily N-acetyltransferase
MQTKILATKEEMLAQFEILLELYPDFTIEKYENLLTKMLPHNYKQIIVQENNETVALTGFWVGHKLWCSKYVEIDNFIVAEKHRGKKIGNILVAEIEKIASTENAEQICLDAFIGNFTAQKFYINCGFAPRGHHYVKYLKL